MSLYNIDCKSCDTQATVMTKAAPKFCPACGDEIVAEEIVAHPDTTSEPVEYVATAPAPASERLEAPSEPEPERLSFN